MELASTDRRTVAGRPDRAARASEARVPSLGTLTDAFVVVFGVLALAVIGALVWTSTESSRAMDRVIRNTATVIIVDELELSVSTYQRLSDLYVLSREPELDDARVPLRGRIQEGLARAYEHADSERERRELAAVEREVLDYLEHRSELEGSGAPLEVVLRESQPPLQRALNSLDALRALNEEEVRQAHASTLRIDRLTNIAGAAAAVLLVAALLAVAVAVRRYVVSPLIELQRALRRYRAGEPDAHAEPRGGAEMREVMEAFEDMTDALRTQRASQLVYLAGVAHDLRTPLSALKTAALLARSERDEERRARSIELIERQAARMERMATDLLDAARIDAGELALDLAPLDVRGVCADVVRLYSPTSNSHTIELSTPSEPVVVEADALRLEQVVGNLVSNAIKYSPHGGTVRVTVAARGDRALVEVADRGIGMTPEQAASVFVPFRRSAKGVAPGVGLGLSVVRRIVQAHGGTVEVESELGVGSTFRVVLPLGPERVE